MMRSPGAVLALVLGLTGLAAVPFEQGSAHEHHRATRTPTSADARSAGRELLLQAPASYLPDAPALVRLSRVSIEPGTSSLSVVLAGPEFLLVEAGQIIADVTGPAVLPSTRQSKATDAQPIATAVVLAQGDHLALPAGTARSFRNGGNERAALLVAAIVPVQIGEPGAGAPQEIAGAEEWGMLWVLGETTVTAFPEGTAAIHLERLALRSGDTVPAFGGPVLVAVEDGDLPDSVLDGAIALPQNTAARTVAVGSAFQMASGQSVFFPQGMAETPTLGGKGRVTVLRLGIVTLGGTDSSIAVPTGTNASIAVPTGPPAAPGTLAVDTRVVVTVPEARLRGAPSLDGPVLTSLTQGHVLVVTGPPVAGPTHVWYPVQARKDPGLAGYVAAELIAPKGT